MANNKLESLLDTATEKMGQKTSINFKESDIDSGGNKDRTVEIPAKGKAKKKQKKVATSVYLTESEHEAFISTFKPLEKKSEKIRELILEYIRKEKKR